MKKLKIITTAITIFASLGLAAFATEKNIENTETMATVLKNEYVKNLNSLNELERIDDSKSTIEYVTLLERLDKDNENKITIENFNETSKEEDEDIKSVNLFTQLDKINRRITNIEKDREYKLMQLYENNENKTTPENSNKTNKKKDGNIKSIDCFEQLNKFDKRIIDNENKTTTENFKEINKEKYKNIKSIDLLTQLDKINRRITNIEKYKEPNEEKETTTLNKGLKKTAEKKFILCLNYNKNNNKNNNEFKDTINDNTIIDILDKNLNIKIKKTNNKKVKNEENVVNKDYKKIFDSIDLEDVSGIKSIEQIDDNIFKNIINNNNNKNNLKYITTNNTIEKKDYFYNSLYGIIYKKNWEKLNSNLSNLKEKIIKNKLPINCYVENNNIIFKSDVIEKLYESLVNLFEIKYYTNENEANFHIKNIDKEKKILTDFKISDKKNNMQEYKEITAETLEILNYIKNINETKIHKIYKTEYLNINDKIKKILYNVKNFISGIANVYEI